MRHTQISRYTEERSGSRSLLDFTKYVVSFGSECAPNKVDIFYGVECGFTKEFLQQDFERLLVKFVLTGKAHLCLYPAALDKLTLAFCSKIYTLPLVEKRKTFMQLCHPRDYSRLISTLPIIAIERIFFDVSRILERNQEISETLMIRVNKEILEEVPSMYSLQQKMT
jgi:hypothetical protein